MTLEELNSCRAIKIRISTVSNHLAGLRVSAENLVPILDGMPHSKEAKSRVERIALEIIEDECELTALRSEYELAQARLTDKILLEVSDPVIQTLLVLRYVECYSFRETARRINYSLRQVFRLHEEYLKLS